MWAITHTYKCTQWMGMHPLGMAIVSSPWLILSGNLKQCSQCNPSHAGCVHRCSYMYQPQWTNLTHTPTTTYTTPCTTVFGWILAKKTQRQGAYPQAVLNLLATRQHSQYGKSSKHSESTNPACYLVTWKAAKGKYSIGIFSRVVSIYYAGLARHHLRF